MSNTQSRHMGALHADNHQAPDKIGHGGRMSFNRDKLTKTILILVLLK